jgi:N-glycosylase/DNA lyase
MENGENNMLKPAFVKSTITIEDDFDLEKIMESGQCFRVKQVEQVTSNTPQKEENGKEVLDGSSEFYRFITQDQVLYIAKSDQYTYEIECQQGAWEQIWAPYFDLSRNYRNIRKSIENISVKNNHEKKENHEIIEKSELMEKSEIMEKSNNMLSTSMPPDVKHALIKAIHIGTGLRILKQDPWEMLITFIISQRKNIPAIAKSVDILSRKYGKEILTPYETLYTFPTPSELSGASKEDLLACGLGYRAPYVLNAVCQVLSGTLDIWSLTSLDDEALYQKLLTVHGVGAKVSNCVCLFGYARTARAPIDVWIARAIDEDFCGFNPFPILGEVAGIIQQYIFYSQRKLHSLQKV